MRRPVWVKSEIRTGYTGNVLLDLHAPSIAGRRFDLARGTTGGEDTTFFSGVHADGGHFTYAPDAEVFEVVPEERANFRWLWTRRLRMGETHGQLLAAEGRGGFSAGIGAVAKALYCLGHAVLTLFSPARRNGALLRGVLHLGTFRGLLAYVR